MSLTDQLHQARHETRKRGPKCSVGKLLAKSSSEDRAALQDALAADPDEWPTVAIARAIQIGAHTVRRHRRGDCSCDRNGATQ